MVNRWLYSTNAKDISVLYFMFALFAGLIGTAFSVIIRMELASPGPQFLQGNNQYFNVVITAHGVLMIFFMVNFKPILSTNTIYEIKSHTNIKQKPDLLKSSLDFGLIEITKKDKNKNFTKIIVEDPFNNRDIIAKVAKKQKGIYIWKTLDGKHQYVGHSINLYNRINSYFMPSILKIGERRVLRYFNKYGFKEVKLIILILPESSTLTEVIELEQYYIDNLNPILNVDLVARGSGFHYPMSQESIEKLRKERGVPIYVYNADNFILLYIFDSKTLIYKYVNIDHRTLTECLDLGKKYLNFFYFSLEPIEENSNNNNIITLDELKNIITEKRAIHNKICRGKAVLAEYMDSTNPFSNKKLEFLSIGDLVKYLKGDSYTIRKYLNKDNTNYYRGKWKLSYINKNYN
jgi:GIY-YIG catalytic domain/Cytochrome C and Quinol oxidase polypeptide I/NUMOD1 domain